MHCPALLKPALRRSLLFAAILLVALPVLSSAGSLLRLYENAVVPAGGQVDDLVVIAGSAEVAGKVTGNVVVIGGNVTLLKTAVVAGDIVCLGGKITDLQGAAVVGSKVEIGGVIGWQSLPFSSIGKLLLLGFLLKVATAVLMLALSIFLVLMWPNQIKCAAEEASNDMVRSSLVGVLAVTLMVPLAIGFTVTVFGLPIALAIFIFMSAAGWFGTATVAYMAGHKMAGKLSPVAAIVIGLLILKMIHFVPLLGGMLYFIVTLPGLGAVLLTRFGTNQPWLKSAKTRGKSR